MKRLPEYFVKGLLFFVPLVVTVYMFITIFRFMDGLLRNLFSIPVPGVGFVLGVILMTGIGFLTTNIFTKGFLNLIDMVFRNVPFVKLVYNSIGDLINAFVGQKRVFNQPVMVTLYSGSQGKALGFITTQDLEHFGLHNQVVVYLPQSYNFAGQTLIFPKESVMPIRDVPSSELMTFIVSAGIAGRQDKLKA